MPGLPMEQNQSQLLIKNEEHDLDYLFKEESPEEEDGSYRPRPQLSKPYVGMRTLGYLMGEALEAEIIDVDPEYQREVVWTAERMTGLVDSLMEEYYIPPIILNKKRRPTQDGEAPRYTLVCVDGKQRLSSVKAFIEGLIPCHDHRGEKWYFIDTGGHRHKKVLPDGTKQAFLEKEFVSFEFADLSPEQEEDLFARVQMGVQLSLAEKMRATVGPWQELARMYVDDFPVIYSLLKDRSRGKDFQITLACFSQIIEAQHPSSANGKPALKANGRSLPKLLDNRGAVDDEIKSHLASVFNTFRDLVNEDPPVFTNVEHNRVQTFAPLEVVAVAVLISMHSETRNNKLLLGDIRMLRNSLRENFVDLRLNPNLWNFVWDYIDSLEAYRGAMDGSTIDRARAVQPRPTQQATSVPPSSVAKQGRPTARIKPPIVKPRLHHENQLADPRTRKRQRVDQTPNAKTQAQTSPSHDIFSLASQTSQAGSSSADPVILDDGLTPTVPWAGSLPVESSVGATLLAEQRASSHRDPVARAYGLEAGHSLPDPLQLITPLQVHQNRISALNSYQAPTTSMISVTPSSSAAVAALSPRSVRPIHSSSVPLPPIPASSEGNPFTKWVPSQFEDQDFRAVHGASPLSAPTQTAPTLPDHSAQKRPAQKTPILFPELRRKGFVATLPQVGGGADPIDLTSDTEQERQDLLSSFKNGRNSGKGR
ncbi:hypothetical protein CC78DRAFT_617666 [Lojkania enalia]|uniref:GmrSD restriction endonucleases N-terminal domain-containing protein n=1 Tax=Lojkania enalia TaxID=147567 RepID=A0A9P4K6B6_9PLEO|nr:hypothetical protein CC78DRAFT_617666 [Didymosphaeria enalia]